MRICRFIIESIKPVQLRKCISPFNKIFLSNTSYFSKLSKFFIIDDFLAFNDLISITLTTGLNLPTHLEKEAVYLKFITKCILFFNTFFREFCFCMTV